MSIAILQLFVDTRPSMSSEFASLGVRMGVGPIGGWLISALVVAAASWELILGLRLCAGWIPRHWRLMSPMLFACFFGSPPHLIRGTQTATLSKVAVYLAAALLMPWIITWSNAERAKASTA